MKLINETEQINRTILIALQEPASCRAINEKGRGGEVIFQDLTLFVLLAQISGQEIVENKTFATTLIQRKEDKA